ncbi:MAG: hypothetical protein JXQ90_22420 [Cyclobacteriaceae bacterium]
MGSHDFKLVGEGCSIYSEMTLGTEQVLSIPELVAVMKQWNDIIIQNQLGQLSLNINQSQKIVRPLPDSMGEIVGTSIIFHGSGEVDQLSLRAQNKMIFEW